VDGAEPLEVLFTDLFELNLLLILIVSTNYF
jgi:hypothetical protein